MNPALFENFLACSRIVADLNSGIGVRCPVGSTAKSTGIRATMPVILIRLSDLFQASIRHPSTNGRLGKSRTGFPRKSKSSLLSYFRFSIAFFDTFSAVGG